MRSTKEILEQGFAHHQAGNHAAAQTIYDRLLGFTDGQDPNVLYAYGSLLAANDHNGLAAFLFLKAIERFPDHAPTWTNLAIVLKNMGRDEASLAAYHHALELEPESGEVAVNLAGWWVNRGHPEEVIRYAEMALREMPDNPNAHTHLALGLLESGRFAEAWPHYRHRWALPERLKDRRPFACPQWQGERVGTLVIHGEQGLGDEILFMGCFWQAHQRAKRVLIECADRLVPIFKAAFKVPCFATMGALKDHHGGGPDAWIAMGDLPGIVGMPDGKPYLPRKRRRSDPPRRVGIAWRGGSMKTSKKSRTMSLELLKPLLTVPGVEFVSVQYGDRAPIEAAACGLTHTLPETRDLVPIHDLIASCDLVITVCQTAVHQAGAMGVDCWVLTPFACAWRYSPAFGDEMAWYRSVKLFRQDEEENWEPVVERMRQSLEARYA